MSSRQSVAALKDWLLGTQAAPACEAGAFIRDRLATAHRSLYGGIETVPQENWMIKREVAVVDSKVSRVGIEPTTRRLRVAANARKRSKS